MPALVIGANLPDVDATCALLGTQSLALRRGITHGPVALVLLPLLLTGALTGFARWQQRRGTRPRERDEVRPGWLFLLTLIACLTHPALDWLNSYGIRLLEPFSSQWFYGDALFIIDWVLWLILGFSAWLTSRRQRAGYGVRGPARIALASSLTYILANIAVSASAAAAVRSGGSNNAVVVANPVPLAFWERDLLYGQPGEWQRRRWSLFTGPGQPRAVATSDSCALPNSALVQSSADASAFLFWSRLPFAQAAADGTLLLRDARFTGPLTGGRFSVATELACDHHQGRSSQP